jgi:branched-chain amino acid transport system substrate-binding protein
VASIESIFRPGPASAMRRARRQSFALVALASALVAVACGPRFADQPVPQGQATIPVEPTSGPATTPTVPTAGATTRTTVIKGTQGSVVTGSVIKVGGLFPKSGGLSALGLPAFQGAVAFFNWANERNLVPGKRFQFITCDDQAVDTQSTTCAKKLIDQDGVFAMGPSFTPFSDTVIDQVDRAGVPWVGFDGINTEGLARSNVVTIGSPIEPMAHALIDYWYRKLEREGNTPKRVGAVVLDVAPARTYMRELKEQICRKLGCEVVREQFVQYTTTQYETICRNMQNEVVDAIWIITDPASAIKLMNGCQNIGYPKGRFLGQHGIYLDLTLAQSGPYSEGMLANSGLVPDTEVTPATTEMKNIIRRYFPNASLGYFTELSFASARMFVDLVAKVVADGKELSRQNLLAAASAITNYDCHGLCKDVALQPPACRSGGNHTVWVVRASFSSGAGRWVKEAGPFDAFDVETWPTPGKPRPC